MEPGKILSIASVGYEKKLPKYKIFEATGFSRELLRSFVYVIEKLT